MSGYYWICYLGSLIIWLFSLCKGSVKEIEENNIYSFYVGLGFILFIMLLFELFT